MEGMKMKELIIALEMAFVATMPIMAMVEALFPSLSWVVIEVPLTLSGTPMTVMK